MEENLQEIPQFIETDKGFNVSYKKRLLYSKYAPKRAIEKAAESLDEREGTLVLCASPLLWYGIEKIFEKIDENSFIWGIEFDSALFEIAKEELSKKRLENPKIKAKLLEMSEIENLADSIGKEHFRRVEMIEMSGGAAFFRDKYKAVLENCQNSISQFWKNRLTLTRFGRLYSKNLVKNTALFPSSVPLKKLFGTVETPIVVFGAGESAESLIKRIGKDKISKFTTICVDAASPILCKMGVKIDFVVTVEAQFAIESSFVGVSAPNSIFLADTSSRARIAKKIGAKVSFFSSEFTSARFLENLKNEDFFPPTVPPLGSVGLTAVHLALLLRKSEKIPVIAAGLDFSFSASQTHARGTFAHTRKLVSQNRFSSDGSFESAFSPSSKKVYGKNGEVFTTVALESYANLFKAFFAGTKNLFDAGDSGIFLNLPKAQDDLFENQKLKPKFDFQIEEDSSIQKKVVRWLENEEKSLNRLCELLTFGESVARCKMSAKDEIAQILSEREYLFLHFPDGYKCRANDVDFLKRVRSEIDFFLKDIKNALFRLSK